MGWKKQRLSENSLSKSPDFSADTSAEQSQFQAITPGHWPADIPQTLTGNFILRACDRKRNPPLGGSSSLGWGLVHRAYGPELPAPSLDPWSRLSALRVLKPPRQQIAQRSGACAKERKRDDRKTDLDAQGKRLIGAAKRAECLDQRRQQTDAGARERRPRHAPGSRILIGREERWEHGSSAPDSSLILDQRYPAS